MSYFLHKSHKMTKTVFSTIVRVYMILLLYSSGSICIAQTKIHTNKWQRIVHGTDTILRQKPSKGDQLLLGGDYAAAVAAYRQLLKEGDGNRVIPYNIACAYAALGNNDSAFFFLPMALEYDSSINVLTDPNFVGLLGDARWKNIEDRQMELQYMKGKRFRNPKLTKELWRMGLRDQAYYSQIKLADKKYGMKNKVADSLWELKDRLNDENLKRLEQIITDYGWPGISLVGRRAANTAFLVIQHATLEMQKKYKPMLMAACNRGEAEWDALALMIDRIEVNEGRPQIYGSQVTYKEDKGIYEPFPIVDEHNLDKRRKEVGLDPASIYYAAWDIQYTVEQNL
jgi:hypothetical protein